MRKHFKKFSAGFATLFLMGNVAFNQPQYHNTYLRWEVGESVVQVLSPAKASGGTGFAVTAASGEEFIMTNKHVCEVAINGVVMIKRDGIGAVFKRVVYVDDQHDLCLIEGDKRLSPLETGSHPSKGDFHYVVGHPGLRQLSVQQGEFIGYSIVELIDDVRFRSECNGVIYDLTIAEQLQYGIDFICIRSYRSYATTATTYPGNSGSPVVDKYGNVIGVLFAGSSKQEKDNYLVPLVHIERVLSKF